MHAVDGPRLGQCHSCLSRSESFWLKVEVAELGSVSSVEAACLFGDGFALQGLSRDYRHPRFEAAPCSEKIL